jgi:hypothetical protein
MDMEGKETLDSSIRLLEEQNDDQSNSLKASLIPENNRIMNENDNLHTEDFLDGKDSEDVQDDFEENEANPGDIQDDFEEEEEKNDSDDIQDDLKEENKNDDIQHNTDQERDIDSTDTQVTSMDGRHKSAVDASKTEHLRGDSVSQLHDMINRANPGFRLVSKQLGKYSTPLCTSPLKSRKSLIQNRK